MQLLHRLAVVNPVEIVDEDGNPVPGLDYRPGVSPRTVYAHVIV